MTLLPTIVLNTKVVSEFMRPNPEPRVLRWLDSNSTSDLCVTTVTPAPPALRHRHHAGGQAAQGVASRGGAHVLRALRAAGADLRPARSICLRNHFRCPEHWESSYQPVRSPDRIHRPIPRGGHGDPGRGRAGKLRRGIDKPTDSGMTPEAKARSNIDHLLE